MPFDDLPFFRGPFPRPSLGSTASSVCKDSALNKKALGLTRAIKNDEEQLSLFFVYFSAF